MYFRVVGSLAVLDDQRPLALGGINLRQPGRIRSWKRPAELRRDGPNIPESNSRSRRLRGALERTLAAIPPASGAVVMGTGVVSIGLSLDGRETLSRILLAFAALGWLALGLLLGARALVNRDRVHREARSPAAGPPRRSASRSCSPSRVHEERDTRPTPAEHRQPGAEDGGAATPVNVSSLVLRGLAIAWLPVLVGAELLHPRLDYDVRRWATVFPVAMYAACSFAADSAADVAAITDFARIWVWVGGAGWLVVATAMLRGGVRLARGLHPPITSERIDAIAPSRRSASGLQTQGRSP